MTHVSAYRGFCYAIALGAVGLLLSPGTALALSEIQGEQSTPPAAPPTIPGQTPPMQEVVPPGAIPDPLPGVSPDPTVDPQATEPETPADDEQDTETGNAPSQPAGPVPDVIYDLATLPEPVRRMHGLIVEACTSGDIEKLRPLLKAGEDGTQISLAGVDGDVIEFLKGMSGDGEGHEILAILMEVLDAGFVHLDGGKPEELYVWPYFFAVPLDNLTAPQRVELFKIVTAGDYEDMKTYGAYVFYRVGITPAGEWAFFIAGD